MSKYQINGGVFEFDDSLQGDDLNNALQQTADFTAQQNKQKFLGLIGKAEGGSYDLIHGAAGQRFTDYSTHPNVVGARTADGPSTAAGMYGITARTYFATQASAGVNDFTPDSQDKIALTLISQNGAADDVSSGNFKAAINKLGGVWASLPSSKYGQGHRSWDWVNQQLAQTGATAPVPVADQPPAAPSDNPPAVADDAREQTAWSPFAKVNPNSRLGAYYRDQEPSTTASIGSYGQIQEKVDPATLATNQDWLKASAQLYQYKERKPWIGSDTDLAEYGKSAMGYFSNNITKMAFDAHQLADHGTQSDKEAFLYLMNQYDSTKFSAEGFGRGVKGFFTDPVNLVGVGTLGTGTIAKVLATTAEKQAVRRVLLTSLGRAGIPGAIIGGIQGGVSNDIHQDIEVQAGSRKEVSVPEIAAHVGLGAGLGMTLGTAADALLTVASPLVKKAIAAIQGRVGGVSAAEDAAKAAQTAPKPGAATSFEEAADPAATAAHVDAAVNANPETVVAAPTPSQAATEAATAAVLPASLAGAKPRWKQSTMSFESDIDKALFITSQAKKSASDDAYRGWLNGQGFSAAEIDSHGAALREHIKDEAGKIDDGEHLHIGEFTPQRDAPLPTQPEAPAGAPTDDPTPSTSIPGDAPDASATTPISTILTQEEVDAATTRSQKGRLWSDDLPHDNDLPRNEHFARDLDIPEQADGLRHTVVNMEQLTKDAGSVADQLRPLETSDLRQTLEVLRTSTTLKDVPVIFRAVQILHDEIRVAQADLLKKINAQPESSEMPKWLAVSKQLEDRAVDIALADDAMGSFGGSLNRQRQEGLLGLQGHTPESIAETHGVPIEQAKVMWQKLVDASQLSQKAKEIAAEYDAKVKDALDQSDFKTVAQLFAQKRRELSGVGEEAAPGGAAFLKGIFSPSAWLHGAHDLAGKVRELFISNLFSVGTLVVNAVPSVVKTLTIPVARAVVSDITKLETRIELGANYSAMQTTFRAALEKGLAGFKYEQAILTRDSGRLMEGGMALTGKTGGALRFFPRLLTASDEFLANVNYASYVAGRAANKATIEGTAKGLAGKALSDFVKLDVEIAKASMYTIKAAGAQGEEAMLQPIVNKGVNLGLSGEELQAYIEKQAAANGKALGFGSDKEALTFARDVLYKRSFAADGEGGFMKRELSNAAAGTEKILHSAPELSLLVGQLFFRTPIRVFEEGIRMTPGVQILAPGFMRDLVGANGTQRQIRAHSESLVAMGFAGAVLSLYAQGRITASGVYMNTNQEKIRRDGPGTPQNSIAFKDGTSWSYNRLDLIAIPMKILTNALEGWDELTIKEAQEGYVNQPARRLIMARLSVGTMAIAQAFKDSNLVSGLNGTIQLGKELSDPEGDEAAIIKKFGSEVAMFVPNTFHKIAQQNDPAARDPATWFQALETRLGHNLFPSDIKTSHAYDALGEVRSPQNVGTIFNMFSPATPEKLERGHSSEHSAVMLEMDRLAQVAGATFASITPTNPMTGKLDLRTMNTKDGQETLFDRLNRNYRELNPAAILKPIVDSKLSEGTYKYVGEKTATIQQTITQLHSAAMAKLLLEEDVRNRMILESTNKARALGGLMDYGNVNK